MNDRRIKAMVESRCRRLNPLQTPEPYNTFPIYHHFHVPAEKIGLQK